MPVRASAARKSVRILSRVAASEPNGTRSSSWNVMPQAPSSLSFSTASRRFMLALASQIRSFTGLKTVTRSVHLAFSISVWTRIGTGYAPIHAMLTCFAE